MKLEKVNTHWEDINMAHLELEKLLLHFEQSNKAEGKSPKTVIWYREMLDGFIKFILSTGQEAVLANFNATIAREFIIHEQGGGLSPFTIQAKVRALKVLSSWLYSEGYTGDNLLSNIKLPKAPSKIIHPLTEEEINRLLSSQNALTAIGSRNTAHLCRHTYATSFLNQRCGDVFRLQQILGHSTLEMVRRYVHFSSTQDMIKGHVSSPLDRIGLKKLRGYKIDRLLKGRPH